MFLVVDIGNSNIKFTFFDNDKVVNFFSIKTEKNKTEYNEIKKNINVGIDCIILSSVVPELTNIIIDELKYFNTKIITFNDKNLKLDIKKHPSEEPDFIDRKVGHDMIADIYYGVKNYKNNFLTIDLGTASVINCVDKNGYYVGSTIFSGLASLSKYISICSQLKDFEVKEQSYNLSPHYNTAINGGIFWAGIGMLEKNVEIAIKSYNLIEPSIIVTGGYFEKIKNFINFKYNLYEPHMTAKGLHEILKTNL